MNTPTVNWYYFRTWYRLNRQQVTMAQHEDEVSNEYYNYLSENNLL